MGMIVNPYAFDLGGGVSTLFSQSELPTSTSALDGYNIRIVLGATNLSGSGTKIRVEIQAGTTSGYDLPLSGAYIGKIASSGNAWDFDGNQVQLLFGGTTTKTISSGEKFFSDWVTFSPDDTSSVIISFAITDSETNSLSFTSSVGNAMYHKAASEADVGTSAPLGYSSSGAVNYCIKSIEVK